MSFVSKLSDTIDHFKGEKFYNNSITLQLQEGELSKYEFLSIEDTDPLARVAKILNRVCSWFYDPNRKQDVIYCSHPYRIRLEKTDYNSIDEQVNPEFLDAMKKATISYFKYLASSWEEIPWHDVPTQVNPSITWITKNTSSDSDSNALNMIAYEKGFKNMKNPIVSHGLKKFNSSPDVVYLQGELEHLQRFFDVIRKEAGEQKEQSLFQIVAKYIAKHLDYYQKQELFLQLPLEVSEKFSEEANYLIKLVESNPDDASPRQGREKRRRVALQ
jgi:hypothetical protein